MKPFEKFMLFVATYLGTLGRHIVDPRCILNEARAQASVFEGWTECDSEGMAWEFVLWEVGHGKKPAWVV